MYIMDEHSNMKCFTNYYDKLNDLSVFITRAKNILNTYKWKQKDKRIFSMSLCKVLDYLHKYNSFCVSLNLKSETNCCIVKKTTEKHYFINANNMLILYIYNIIESAVWQ